MKNIDLKQPLKNINGEVDEQIIPVKYDELVDGELVQKQRAEKMTLTLGKLLEHCLFHREGEQTEEEILQRIDLIERIHNNETAKFNEEEIKLLKTLVIKKYDVFFAGSALRMLNK